MSSSTSLPSGALIALGVGGFSLGMGEFVTMGLVPDIARDLGASIPSAAALISAYAVGVALGAPVLAVALAGRPPRVLLIGLMSFYALANGVTAIAPGLVSLVVARFASGLPHGAYFGIAAVAAAVLAPADQRARAVGFVMLGLAAAMLVGPPLGAALSETLGWRAAFAIVAAIAGLGAALIRTSVAHVPAEPGTSPLKELGALARPRVLWTLATGAIGFGGMFCVGSYIKPALLEAGGVGASRLPLVLSLFGCGGIAGNLIAARMADRAQTATIVGALIYAATVLAAFGALVRHTPTAPVAVFLLGGIVALGPALQVRLIDVAGDAKTLAAASSHSAFNVANALGAYVGGLAIGAGWGWTSLGWVGALLALGGLIAFGASLGAQVHAEPRP